MAGIVTTAATIQFIRGTDGPKANFTHTIQSTASMRDRSLVGKPMASRMMAMVMMPPAGIPAAPTLEAVAVTLETITSSQINFRFFGENRR